MARPKPPTAVVIARPQVPRSMATVYREDDPSRTPLAGMPDIALWEEYDRHGQPVLARYTGEGLWRLAAEPGPATLLVRVGRGWSRGS